MPFIEISLAAAVVDANARSQLVEAVERAVALVEGNELYEAHGIGVAIIAQVDRPDWIRNCVAFLRVTVIKNALTREQLDLLATSVSEAAVQVIGEAYRFAVWVVLEESVMSGDWRIGGHPLTLEALARIKRRENPW
jgi:phenylpyruvate tautomerase PptA (4-oxalocrotonate tautomerase family)